MPFGLSGVAGSFQRLMDKVFWGLNFVKAYVDDVFIYSGTKDEHVKHLTAVFQCLKDAGLSLRGNRCHIGLSKVCYLEHIFSAKGMMPDDRKVSVVRDWPISKDAGEVHQFLGLASYYRHNVLNITDIAAPLHNMTQRDTMFKWSPECDTAFNMLKEKLTETPILAYPKFGPDAGIFTLDTDASDVDVGAVLEQDGRVIAYISRALSKSERNYSFIQKECLAIVYAIKQLCHYLFG